MLDRVTAPETKATEKVSYIEPEVRTLSNGMKILGFNIGSQEVIQLEFNFHAGSKYQEKSLIARYVSKMIGEASSNYVSGEIMDKIDYYGAFLQSDSDRDMSHVTLFTIQKQLKHILPVFAEALLNPTFPERELNIHLKNGKQNFKVENEKVGYRCRQLFTELLFKNHAYGKFADETAYDELSASMLIDYYKKMYSASNGLIVVAGKFDDSLYSQLEKEFGVIPIGKNKIKSQKLISSKAEKVYEEKPGAIQSGIRIGRVLNVKYGSNEFFKLQIINTILGGYFGSRLMSNIREDKGYTYGIGSAIVSMEDAIFFFISAEVGADVTNETLQEVYFELNRLCDEIVPKEELLMVKNYMLGSMLKSSDGPFSMAGKYKKVYLKGEDLSFYDRYISMINNVTSEELFSVAKKYFNPEKMLEVVVGKK
jgi:predicted Zn-dependent peptidase